MATTKSTVVTNADADKQNKLFLAGGTLREIVATVEIAAADSDNHEYRLARVHSSWRISEIIRYNDAITSGADFDVGLYTVDGGAVVDANLFADAISLTSASVVGVRDQYEIEDIADAEKRIWEQLGLSTDPNLYYDLTYTGITVGSGAGTLTVHVRYVDGT